MNETHFATKFFTKITNFLPHNVVNVPPQALGGFRPSKKTFPRFIIWGGGVTWDGVRWVNYSWGVELLLLLLLLFFYKKNIYLLRFCLVFRHKPS